MNDQHNDKINYTAADIQRYIDGQMSAGEMHDLESHALEDPFLADAIDGYGEKESAADTDTAKELQELYARLATRIATPRKTTIIPFFKTGWFKIAAMVLVIAGSGTLVYYLANNARSNDTLIAKTQKPEPNASDSSTTPDGTNSDSMAVALNEKAKEPALLSPGKKNDQLKSSSTMSAQLEETPIARKQSPSASMEKSLASTNDSGNSVASLNNREPKRESKSKAATAPSVAGYDTIRKNKVFSGKVVDVQNQPVPNLVVSTRTRNRELDVRTDSTGVFSFSAADTPASVVIRKEGFETARADLKIDSRANEIVLKQATSIADKAANAGGAVALKSKARGLEVTPGKNQNAVPVIGLPAFNEYIEKNKSIKSDPVEARGEVIVSFTVRKDGTRSNFKIKKSLSKHADNEAIRLIKEGPAWKLLTNREAVATVTIKF